jgi:hypothetical protein
MGDNGGGQLPGGGVLAPGPAADGLQQAKYFHDIFEKQIPAFDANTTSSSPRETLLWLWTLRQAIALFANVPADVLKGILLMKLDLATRMRLISLWDLQQRPPGYPDPWGWPTAAYQCGKPHLAYICPPALEHQS